MNAPSKAMELKAAISAVLAGMTAFWGVDRLAGSDLAGSDDPGLRDRLVGRTVDRHVG